MEEASCFVSTSLTESLATAFDSKAKGLSADDLDAVVLAFTILD